MAEEDNQFSSNSNIFNWLDKVPNDVKTKKTPDLKRKGHPLSHQSSQVPTAKSRRLGEVFDNKEPDGTLEVTRVEENARDLGQTAITSRPTQIRDGLPETFERSASQDRFAAPHVLPRGGFAADSNVMRYGRLTKQELDTPVLGVPINLVSIVRNVPDEVHELVQDLGKIAMGKGVIPRQIQHKMGVKVESHELMDEKEEDKPHPGRLDHEAFWVRANELWQIAVDGLESRAPEAAWNGEIHCQLLRLALRGHWKDKNIWYQDVTTARVTDETLLPTAASAPTESKLIDYAMVIHSDTDFRNRIVTKLCNLSNPAGLGWPPSINPTSAEWIRFNPIAVGIETVSEVGFQDFRHVQLGTWAVAHLLKLDRLMQHPSTKPPVLPVINVMGHQWKLMLASMVPGPKLHLLCHFLIGDTSTLIGIYRIIAAIRRLARWIDEQYRPWFEKEILGDRGAEEAQP